MKQDEKIPAALTPLRLGGLTGWLLGRLRSAHRRQPRLELLERITLAPRHSLALVEAEGRRFLVATSSEGGPAFYALDTAHGADARLASAGRPSAFFHSAARPAAPRPQRVSW
jgi:flagellar biogenesis protein FliO